MKIGPESGAGQFTAIWSDVCSIGMDRKRGGYSRHLFDDADMTLRTWFIEQAQRRGLTVETDRNTNVWAWSTPASTGAPQELAAAGEGPGAGPALSVGAVVTGSHLDSVPGGGAFDGALGVVSALLAIDELTARGHQPRRPIAVVAFAEEEGSRFGLPCLGSRLLTGAADADHARRLRDADGTSLADAARHAGFDPELFGPDPERIALLDAFVELHSEQGRELSEVDPVAQVAVGTHIGAHGRWRLTFTGQGNHAGTTKLSDRRDPLIPAAATVLAARRLMSQHPDGVATVGRIAASPGGTNVIASSVELWLDARMGSSGQTSALVDGLLAAARQEAELEDCLVVVRRESLSDEVIFDPSLGLELTALLGVPSIATGAGHDAGVLAPQVPTAMLFVRNPSGISHSPAEHLQTADCLAGIQALADVLAELT